MHCNGVITSTTHITAIFKDMPYTQPCIIWLKKLTGERHTIVVKLLFLSLYSQLPPAQKVKICLKYFYFLLWHTKMYNQIPYIYKKKSSVKGTLLRTLRLL